VCVIAHKQKTPAKPLDDARFGGFFLAAKEQVHALGAWQVVKAGSRWKPGTLTAQWLDLVSKHSII